MSYRFVAIVSLLSLIVPSQVRVLGGTITTLYSTGEGLDASGPHDPMIVDSHYTIISAPAGATLSGSTPADAYTTPAGSKNVAAPSGIEWIAPSPNNSLTEPEGNYEYQTTFSLAGFVASTAMITGEFAADNDLYGIVLNGVSLGISGGDMQSFTDFTISTGFVSGVNTLDFIVFNGPDLGPHNNPTALLVDMSGTATAAVPEPSSLVIAAIGCSILGCFYGVRRGRLIRA